MINIRFNTAILNLNNGSNGWIKRCSLAQDNPASIPNNKFASRAHFNVCIIDDKIAHFIGRKLLSEI